MNTMIKTEKFTMRKSVGKSVFSMSLCKDAYNKLTSKVLHTTDKFYYDGPWVTMSRYIKYSLGYWIYGGYAPTPDSFKLITQEMYYTPVRSGFRLFFINLDWKCLIDDTNKVFYRIDYHHKMYAEFHYLVSDRIWNKLEYNGYYTMVKVERWGIDFFKAVKPVYAIPGLTSLQFKPLHRNGGYLGLAKGM